MLSVADIEAQFDEEAAQRQLVKQILLQGKQLQEMRSEINNLINKDNGNNDQTN